MSNTQKVAFITGAAKRIGKQTALSLHEQGFDVIIHCNNSANEAKELCLQLNAKRINSAVFLQADLLKINSIKKLVMDSIQVFGRIDVLINNASTFYPTPVNDVTETVWDDLFGTNLKAPFFLSQALTEELSKNKGSIINMVDIHADKPLKDYSVYCMAKAGLVMLTKSLARELAPNIRVNGVAPGAILWHENELTEQDKIDVLSEISLQKLGSPKDIAQAISFLIQAEYVTGQIIAIDGGRSVYGSEKA